MRRYATALFSLCLTSCAVGPTDHRLVASPPAQWATESRGTLPGVEPQTDLWWASFQDAGLNSLVRRAVEANLDLKIATARVEEARAARGLARSDLRPQLSAGASATRDRQTGVGLLQTAGGVSAQRFPYEASQYGVSGGLAWEIDLFGRIRRGVEAANADLAASEQDRRNVLITLLGEVGASYAELRGSQLRLDIARKNIAIAEDTLDLTRQRVNAGQATGRDVSQAEAQLQSVRAQVPVLNTDIQVAIHRIGILLGTQPGTLVAELLAAAPLPPSPPDVPTGVPTDLLLRRPDIQRAEAQFAAAAARAGQAKADYFPRFTLLGTAGRQATELHDLSLGLGNFFAVGPSVSVPLFTGGKLRSNLALQEARVKQAAASYQSTVLQALEETEDALAGYGNEQERRDRLQATVQAGETAFELATVQYRAGLTDFLTVLDAQRELYGNRDLLAQSQTRVTTNLVNVYRALGGGWSVSPYAP